MEKKAKAEAKRLRRNERKQAAVEGHTEAPDEAPAADNVDIEQVDAAVNDASS